MRIDDFGLPIGPALPAWSARPHPPRSPLTGRFCRVEPLDASVHTGALYESLIEPPDDGRWTYLAYGPFPSRDHYRHWLEEAARQEDPMFHAIVEPSGRALGVAAYLRIDRGNGVIEVGHVHFSAALQRTAAATEAMYLMMCRTFDELGYRRYEWKCDSLNEPSRRAAVRLGFTYEGLFRQATVCKQRSRDTSWYSMVDGEWPARKRAFEAWLAPENFDESGVQRRRLSEIMGGYTL